MPFGDLLALTVVRILAGGLAKELGTGKLGFSLGAATVVCASVGFVVPEKIACLLESRQMTSGVRER